LLDSGEPVNAFPEEIVLSILFVRFSAHLAIFNATDGSYALSILFVRFL